MNTITKTNLFYDLMLIANRDQKGKPQSVSDQEDDVTGELTISSLRKSLRLVSRISGAKSCENPDLHIQICL